MSVEQRLAITQGILEQTVNQRNNAYNEVAQLATQLTGANNYIAQLEKKVADLEPASGLKKAATAAKKG